jgi:hypothetical protein
VTEQVQEPPNIQIARLLAPFTHDPLGFVKIAFPWGTGELQGYSGPRQWQAELFDCIGSQLRANHARGKTEPIRECACSGHGIGKSAFVGMIINWAMSTCVDTRIVVTAGTEKQLLTKTWPELAKWHRLAVNSKWFTMTETTLYSNVAGHDKTWRCDKIPWRKNNTESFAGLHNKRRRILVIEDEASQIPDEISDVIEGAMTDEDTEIIWLKLGNPTRNTGRFKECWGRFRHRWSRGMPRSIDSRTVEGTNKKLFQQWVDDYGEDSDFVRVRVRGMFPRASSLQYIDSELVAEAMKRPERYNIDDPLIMSLDIARGGDDNNVISFRHGLDMRTRPQIVVPGSETRDTGRFVDLVVETVEREKPEVVFGDATGVGGPVLDRLRRLGINVIDVQFGAASPDPKYANMRAFIAARFKQLLEQGLALENNPYLESEITSIEYTHDIRDRLILERKEHMKERGLASPDRFDSACMCCLPFHGRAPISHVRGAKRTDREKGVDYDPFG